SKSQSKFIFVSGGVLSGLGKGLCAASIGYLLKQRGYSVSCIKCENYLNIDSGTINPIEHGDPFLCEDGLESDMDLGTYERFLEEEMGFKNFTTMGQIYKSVIDRERSMGYEGEDVEAIPHVVDEIIARIEKASEGYDFTVIELGGTAGEYQNALYYEACRTMKALNHGSVINVHVSYMPVPAHLGEPKTKPTQTSVRTLMSMGIQPEFLILRSEVDMDKRRKYLLGLKTSIPGENVIMAKDLDIIYELPLNFADQEFDKKILNHFNMDLRRSNLKAWKELIAKIKAPKKHKKSIAIVGKYLSKNEGDYELTDAYHALIEAIRHTCWHNDVQPDIKFIPAQNIELNGTRALSKVDAIIVPIGWGTRGVEGKIRAIKYARENKIPYLGLCYGMQLAAVEFARNVCGLKDAHTEEVAPDTKNKIIHQIPFDPKYQQIKGQGTSMRLGAYDCVLKKGTLIHKIYSKHKAFKKENTISERHRHRFEFNNEYRELLESNGLVISGTSPDNFFVEMIELPKEVHPFFVATQAHPEYKSMPLKPHPMFVEFIKATI
ncbi:CTP synthase, partial [Candidatus Dojkabacteria bacterium]|nr:CTP synthase [Candidatus Dojkabacteria bacterium]